jgi:dihydropteroate synthase
VSFSRLERIPSAVSAPAVPPAPRVRHPARVLEVETLAEIAREVERTESDPEGVGIMTRKGRIYPVRLEGVSLKAAPLLKQETLSVGGDSAHARGIADHSVASTSVVILATWGQYQRLVPKLRRQPFRLAEAAEEIDRALRAYVAHGPRTVRGPHRSFVVGDRPRVMGVVNVTPDSFSDGGLHLDPVKAVAHAKRLAEEGAEMIDIGGESTRPGAAPVSAEVEWGRIGPVLAGLAGSLSVPISVDTRHPEVAAKAVDAGADVVNDVEGLRASEMRRVVARSGAAAVVMHMRGTPGTMQSNTTYADLRGEVFATLAGATDSAIADGVAAERILVDPGLGFGKSAEQSLELLLHLGELRSLGFPVVVGASRKSFLGWVVGHDDPGLRLEAGLAAAVIAAERGASFVRAHDVAPTVRALAVVRAARALAHGAPGSGAELAAADPEA